MSTSPLRGTPTLSGTTLSGTMRSGTLFSGTLFSSFTLFALGAGCAVEHGGPEDKTVDPELNEEQLHDAPIGQSSLDEDGPEPGYGDRTAPALTRLAAVAGETGHATEPTEADLEELQEALAPTEDPVQAQGALVGGDEPAGPLSTTWTWVPDDELPEAAVCMDGSATGLGLSLQEGATETLVFFQGGGACFNGTTCTLSEWWLTNDSFDESSFEDWLTTVGQQGLFDRTREENPYRDYNFVFLPYCSGDVFGGLNEDGPGGRVHVGYRNVGIWLDHVQDTLDPQSEWVVAGSSAGGFGATYNFARIQAEVAPAPVSLLADAAPVFSNEYTTSCLQERWKEAWGLEQTLPSFFEGEIGYTAEGEEGEGLAAMFEEVVAVHPDNRFALVAGDEDTVIRFFYGIGHSWGCNLPWIMSKSSFSDGLVELRDELMAPYDNFSLYTVHSTTHMFLNDERMYATSESSWPLTSWLEVFEAGDNPGSWW